MDIVVGPGSMGLAALLIDLFGLERVIVGQWLQPCGVRNATDDDITALSELLNEFGVTVTEKVGGWGP